MRTTRCSGSIVPTAVPRGSCATFAPETITVVAPTGTANTALARAGMATAPGERGRSAISGFRKNGYALATTPLQAKNSITNASAAIDGQRNATLVMPKIFASTTTNTIAIGSSNVRNGMAGVISTTIAASAT